MQSNPDVFANPPVKAKTYDDLFKEILETFPSRLVIAFLNSTFGHQMPENSIVVPYRTESNTENRVIADYVLKVNEPDGTERFFHIEAQTKNDNRMASRMVEYGFHIALSSVNESDTNEDILIEFPNAVVFFMKDNKNTPKQFTITVKAPDGQKLSYIIPTERMSDYTPVKLLEENKFPFFPFYMANFNGKEPERFESEWLEGCAKLNELVKDGRIEKSDANKLLDSGSIVIKRAKHPNEKEVLNKMTMFDVVGVGVDWIEVKRQQEAKKAEGIAEGERNAKIALVKCLLDTMTHQEVADRLKLPLSEVEELSNS